MIKSLSFDNIVHIIPQDLWEVSANVNKYIVLFATHYFTNSTIMTSPFSLPES